MRAMVLDQPGRPLRAAELPDPEPGPGEALLRVHACGVCRTDLHLLDGEVSVPHPPVVPGHQIVATVERAGAGTGLAPGARVGVPWLGWTCGRCRYCRSGNYGQCLGGGGWVLGHLIDGTQAELVRTPFAERSLYPLPPQVSDESALMLSDILPTGFEVGVLNGRVQPGDTVAVVGAGPIGLAAIKTAKLFSPARIVAIDLAKTRLDAALEFGADVVVGGGEDAVDVVRTLTSGLGADTAIEAVGVPDTFDLCSRLIRPGGHLANVGVHGSPVSLHLESLWIRNVTITTGLVDTSSTPTLLSMLAAGQLSTTEFVTHRFGLGEMMEAYDVFGNAAETSALKVALFRT